MSKTRHRAIAVVASAQSCCAVCDGDGEVQVRAVPVGAWVTTRCPHCRANGVPIFPLPWHEDTERNTA
jgi:DnaJ-class molecular chaperone